MIRFDAAKKAIKNAGLCAVGIFVILVLMGICRAGWITVPGAYGAPMADFAAMAYQGMLSFKDLYSKTLYPVNTNDFLGNARGRRPPCIEGEF